MAIKAVWEMQKNGRVAVVGPGTVEGLLERYLRDRNRDRKQNPKSAHCSRQVLKQFAGWSGNPAGNENRPGVDREMADALESLSDFLQIYLLAAPARLSHLVRREGLLAPPSMKDMRLPRPKSPGSIRSSALRTDRLLAVQLISDLQLIMHLGFFAGLRPGEMLAMRADWIQNLLRRRPSEDRRQDRVPSQRQGSARHSHPSPTCCGVEEACQTNRLAGCPPQETRADTPEAAL